MEWIAPTFADVLQARLRIRPHLAPTPLFTYAALSREAGTEVWVKHENHLPVGAFKVRGGVNLVSQLSDETRRRGVIAASTGNHGQSIAYAARLFGARAIICVPEGANPVKMEAMRDFGSDKPDLRVPLKLTELTDAVKDVDFKVFSGPANAPGGRVCALRVPGGGALTRGELDAYTEYAKGLGAKGLAWIKVNQRSKGAEGLQSPIVKNLHAKSIAEILNRTAAQDGDVILFGADEFNAVAGYMGALRQKVGHDRLQPVDRHPALLFGALASGLGETVDSPASARSRERHA